MNIKNGFRMLYFILSIFIMISMSTGCVNNDSALPPLDKNEKYHLKVMFFTSDSLMNRYGEQFMLEYENITLTSVPLFDFQSEKTLEELYEQLIEENQPDILFFYDAALFSKFIRDGRLVNLDPYIKLDDFDLENLHSGAIDAIRKYDINQNIYGLAPTFLKNAIYYNKDLFEQYKVSFPKNKMNWDEVLQLAEKIHHKHPDIYGMMIKSTPYQFLMEVANVKKLKLLNEKGDGLAIQSDEWKKLWNMVANGIQNGSLYFPDQTGDPTNNDVFLQGDAAMVYSGFSYVGWLENHFKRGEVKSFHWDVVTEPIDDRNPDFSHSVDVNHIFAIHSASQNERAAWEFIKFINGPKIAESIAQEEYAQLITRMPYTVEKDSEHQLNSFFMLKKKRMPVLEEAPSTFFDYFHREAERELERVLNGEISVEEALEKLSSESKEYLF